MINLGLYKAVNIPFFKEFTLDLSYRGVTVIRGRNLNAKDMEGRNNGSGKSLLLSGIAEVLISSSPAIDRNEMFARKTLFPNPSSQIILEVDKHLVAKGRFGGASVSYGIETKTGGLEKVKKDVAQEYLAENLGYNEDSFYTLIYLDGGRDFPLIVGSAVQRIQFLSNIFDDLGTYEALYEHFNQKTKDYNEQVYNLEVLEEELAEMKGDQPEDISIPTDKDIEKITTQWETAKKKASNIRKELSAAEMANTWIDLMLRLEASAEKINISVADTPELFKREERLRRKNKDYRVLKSQIRKASIALEVMGERITKLENSDIDDSKYDQIDGSASSADRYREDAKYISTTMNSTAKVLGLPFRVKAPDTYRYVPYLETVLEFMMLCVMPGENVISRESKTSPTAIGKKLPQMEQLEIVSELSKVRKKLDSMLKAKVVVSKLGEALSDKEIKRIKKARENRIELEDLQEESELRLEEQKLRKSRLSEMKEVKIRSEEDFAILQSMNNDFITLQSLGLDDPSEMKDSDISKLRDEQSKLDTEIAKLTHERTEMRALKEFHENNQSQVDRLQAKIDKLEKYRTAFPVVEGLKKAFSNKGVRVLLLSKLASVLSTRMNANAHLAFPEPIAFQFEITDKTCEILAIRNPGEKHSVISDIRTLSRGERKSFCLVLLYSLLPLLPNDRRLNLTILDEMTSNMDAPTKQKIFRDFIPALREIVPHVIIADTGNLELDDAREYVVEKVGNTSTLIEEVH